VSKVFVTGATGFIGSHIVTMLLNDGHDVTINNRMLDFSKLGRIDFCFHLAANNDTTSLDRQAIMKSNLHCPKELFNRLLEDHGCKKLIYASSAAVYGDSPVPFTEDGPKNPLNYYAESKLLFDEWVLESDIPAIGLRYSNVFGLNEDHKKNRASMISQILWRMRVSDTIQLFKFGEQRRDWFYIKDVVNLNKRLMESECNYKIMNCGSGRTASINEIAETIGCVLSVDYKIDYVDCPFEGMIQKNTELDLSRSKELGYMASYTIESGISEMVKK
jgi:ADP-L-glycero-D-manno-heptose 6-epimerase